MQEKEKRCISAYTLTIFNGGVVSLFPAKEGGKRQQTLTRETNPHP